MEAPGTEWSWEISGWAARKRWKCGSSENIISRLIREGFRSRRDLSSLKGWWYLGSSVGSTYI